MQVPVLEGNGTGTENMHIRRRESHCAYRNNRIVLSVFFVYDRVGVEETQRQDRQTP